MPSRNSFTSIVAVMFVSVALFATAQSAAAQIIMTEINHAGDVHEFQIPPTYAGESALFLARSKGNVSEFLDLALSGPAGLRITAEAAVFQGSVTESFVSSIKWYPIRILNKDGKSVKSLQVKAEYENDIDFDIPTPISTCGLSFEQIVDYTVKHYLKTGKVLTEKQVCKTYGKKGMQFEDEPAPYVPVNPEETGKVKGGIILSKNACTDARKSSYLVRFKVSFTNVNSTKLATGFPIKIQLRRQVYGGDMASSIKPVSDGKFKPKPLALMSALTGGFVNITSSGPKVSYGKINVVRWNKKSIKSVETLSVADLTFYRGMLLTRTPLDTDMLRGGKATFELYNGRSIYGVCFELERKRQRVHGYP